MIVHLEHFRDFVWPMSPFIAGPVVIGRMHAVELVPRDLPADGARNDQMRGSMARAAPSLSFAGLRSGLGARARGEGENSRLELWLLRDLRNRREL